ncbi:MAG: alginate lyase family protein [Promethearchaeota archaeon]
MFGSLRYVQIRESFFNNQLFAYSNKNEKEKIIEYLNYNCNEEISNYLHYADKIINREFNIFEITYKFQEKINWHYSFFNDFSWQLQKSENIDIRPQNQEVDVKYVWEFNRHQFLTYLGFAYYYTKDEKYAKEFRNLILDWIKNNPTLYGINWYSGLEISIRLISWIFTLYFFESSKEINNDLFFKEIFKSIFQHVYYLKYFYTRRGLNHTIGELFGLYLFSKVFRSLKPTQKWEKKYLRKFKKQIILQTRPDGTNIEQSVNYHRFVLEFFSLFYILDPNSLKREERDLIGKMYDYLLYIIRPNGTFPLIGDFDDGKVLLLTTYKESSFIDLINLGSIIFQREDLNFISKRIFPSSILLLGPKGYEIHNKLNKIIPNNTYKYFKNSGYIVIRNNWSEESNYLFVDFGVFGAKSSGHTHSSITNFIYSYKGKDIINDSGTYSYNKSWKERNLFRSSKAHNILVVNNQNQAKIKSWFSWEDKPKLDRSITINQGIDLTCRHNGYKRFFVERKILTTQTLIPLILKDKVIPLKNLDKSRMYRINLYLHFDKNAEIKLENNIITINKELEIEVLSEDISKVTLEKFYYSPNYGIKEECWILNVHLDKKFNNNKLTEITTLIHRINN